MTRAGLGLGLLMGTFNDREQGFESKYAHDQDREFRATARRNRMLGEWAARRMGLENVEDYARAVVKSEVDQPGDDDVLRKVSQDLSGSGLSVPLGEIRAKMDEFLAIARGQLEAGK
jgi:hypothetical protein